MEATRGHTGEQSGRGDQAGGGSSHEACPESGVGPPTRSGVTRAAGSAAAAARRPLPPAPGRGSLSPRHRLGPEWAVRPGGANRLTHGGAGRLCGVRAGRGRPAGTFSG